ncbi:scavenger receptor cysteine-rich type 1 protein M130-like [Chiloscyllium plagiosum]|uniref:scavenger receptor cysteine-rich type 1 protein M130-like n=1 Tax=Chiloscyllium plagiosum TaxID=36176 RepID=UPI001CB880D4|nr:scavenger receptor cysteine-rich type 1 protein M130-like [Chiloscyllium plagiosum]
MNISSVFTLEKDNVIVANTKATRHIGIEVHKKEVFVILESLQIDKSPGPVGIQCRLVDTQADLREAFRLRLENGGGRCAGRLEIEFNGQRFTVNHNEWDLPDATVVCRQLNCGTAVSALGGAHFGPGSGLVIYLGIECKGTERMVLECPISRIDNNGTSHDNDIGVICSDHIIPRLVPGNSQCFGRLEVLFGDTWKTVCGLDWDLKNANVVCAQLHCGVAVSVSSSAHSGGSTVLMGTEVFKCTGNETQLGKCPWSSTTHQDCIGHNSVTLICSGNHGLRLVGGEHRCSGRVEVLHGEQWGTLCGDYFDAQTASVVCEHLQCGTAKSIPKDARFGREAGPMWKQNYKCRGNEKRLGDCTVLHEENFNCSHGNVANVICSAVSDENFWPRLVNGGSRCDGRVEIYYNGSWDTVQDTLWDLSEADVLCRQLECGHALETYNTSKYGDSSERGTVHSVQCHGQELLLRDCNISNTLNQFVSDSTDVGVLCSEHIQLRLSDGWTRCAGRLEIYYGGIWGSVCDDAWDEIDAQVVCKQLGCGKTLDMTPHFSFEPGSGPIWLKDVKCSGNESLLWECPSAQLGQQDDCSHKEDVRIVCSEHKEVRLANGKHRCQGRIEVFDNGTWGTVCLENPDGRSAERICEDFDCGDLLSIDFDAQSFGKGTGPVWLGGLECLSHRSAVRQCQADPWGRCSSGQLENAGVFCSERNVTKEQSLNSNSCDQRSEPQHSVRLDGGRSNCSGRVEIMCDKRWGTVCGDSWDITDANVVCRQMGCGFAVSAGGGAPVSLSEGVIWQNDVKCKGSESFLSDCLSPAPAQMECNHKEIASVICSEFELLLTSPSPPPAGQESKPISTPVVVGLTLGTLLICELFALLVVMQRKLEMKEPHTGDRDPNLGLYQGIYEEIEDIPPAQKTDPKHGSGISIDSVNHIEYCTSHNVSDNSLEAENPGVNFNSIPGPLRADYDDIETEDVESQDGQLQLDSDPDEALSLTNNDNGHCVLGER